MSRDVSPANRAAWDRVAVEKFGPLVERDLDELRGGGGSLLPVEGRELAPLLAGRPRVLHLQCSHGQDALSLWKRGAREVIGVDFSAEMLALARRKSESLGAPATWHQADVLAPPSELSASAELLYTGKGALCWVSDLARWAEVVSGLLAPGGHLYVFEGHPLNWLWEPEASDLEIRGDADYFARDARVNRDFPGLFLAHVARPGESPLQAFERQWTLGEVVTSLARAGLELVTLNEHPENFWPQHPRVPEARARRVPRAYSLVMRSR